jgi:molybdopterin converting factor small subunit
VAVAALLAEAPDRLADVVAISSLVSDGRRLDPASGDQLPAGATVDVLPPFAGG